MLKLTDILTHIQTRVNKDQSGNTYRIDQFNVDLAVANVEMFSRLYGLPEQYRPGQPLPQMSFEVTQKLIDDLKKCKVNMGGIGTNDPSAMEVLNGKAPIPPDYVHWVSMVYNQATGDACDNEHAVIPRNIELITDAQWADRIGNYIKNKYVNTYPYANVQNEYFQFRPKWKQQYINFVYLRTPKKPLLDYVIRQNGTYKFLEEDETYTLQPGEVYRTGQTSGTVVSQTQEIEWPDDIKTDIANVILGYISDNLRQQFLKQSSEQRKVTGI